MQATAAKIAILFAAARDLGVSLDGHTIGRLGEVFAAEQFGLALVPNSTKGHDALAPDGRKVEIKTTTRAAFAYRHAADRTIALHLSETGEFTVVYNGPGAPVWAAAGKMGSNGQRVIGLSTLRRLDQGVAAEDRLLLVG